jgi:ABC-type polysaccharide/polyol phosphate transport system ATPase subunit
VSAASSDYAIKVSHVSKSYQLYDSSLDRLKEALHPFKKQYYKDFYALKDVSFELPKGKAYGIIGFNGSGKSTLLKIICGVTKESAGAVEVKGKISALLELGAGFNPEFTGQQNIYFSGVLAGISREDMRLRYDEIVAFADIGEFVDQPVKSYSSGMLMRLAFAVAVHVDPDILVIDEALAVGDARFRHKCMAKIRSFKDSCTILFVSHDMSAVLSFCDCAIWLDAGKMIVMGDPKEVAQLYMEATYEGTGSIAQRQATKKDKGASETEVISSQNCKVESFGLGNATITACALMGADGAPKENICCGEQVILSFQMRVDAHIDRPIVGFAVSNRLGLMVFGFNNLIAGGRKLEPFHEGEQIDIKYSFMWPDVEVGSYIFTIAVADGVLDEHEHQHWIHDALVVNCFRDDRMVGMFNVGEVELQVERSRD